MELMHECVNDMALYV